MTGVMIGTEAHTLIFAPPAMLYISPCLVVARFTSSRTSRTPFSTIPVGNGQRYYNPLILRIRRPAPFVYREYCPQTQPIQCSRSGADTVPGRGHCGASGIQLDSDGAAAKCFLDWELERVVAAMVVECADGGVCGELADCGGAVGVFWSAGERVDEVDAVEIVVGG